MSPKNVTLSKNSKAFLSCPDLSLGKGKPVPCRGFSRLVSTSVAQLGQPVLTGQMENVQTLTGMFFLEAEANGIPF